MTRFGGGVDAERVLVDADIFGRGVADGNPSFLVTFADDPDIAYIEVEGGQAEIDDLADPKSAPVHRLPDGFVAASFRFTKGYAADDVFDLIEAEYVRQGSFEFGGFQEGGGVFFDDLFDKAIFIERPDTGEDAGPRGRA